MRAVAIALLLAVSAGSARADEDLLAEAIRLEAALDYGAALAVVERAIAQGTADRDRIVALHLFAGKLAAGLDREQVALDHFARVLALAPTTTFAEGTSPKIVGRLDAARARSVPLRVTATIERGVVALAPAADPLGLVVGIAAKLVDGGREREVRARDALRLAVPAGAHVTEVSALDVFGNRVWSQPNVADGDHAVSARPLRPLYARWPFWATGSAIALTAGGVCGWRFGAAQSEWNQLKAAGADYSDLEAVERRGRRWGLAANLSFGVAAASTLLAIVTAARGSYGPVVSAQSDAVGLAIAGRF